MQPRNALHKFFKINLLQAAMLRLNVAIKGEL